LVLPTLYCKVFAIKGGALIVSANPVKMQLK